MRSSASQGVKAYSHDASDVLLADDMSVGKTNGRKDFTTLEDLEAVS